MKKILPSIFIFLIIVNIFAPLGMQISKRGNITVTQNIAHAEETQEIIDARAAVVKAQKDLDDAIAAGKVGQDLVPFQTALANATNFLNILLQKSGGTVDTMPECGYNPVTWFTGCMARLLYYILFVPTSYLFALTGQFFDFSFSYSVNDASYRSAFVVEGWGLVRDFCNIFFIFVLLYVAFSTILKIHGFNTKGMIINVVIIGLLINFSLFAAQVIIDTSNILARVFYNSDAIKITNHGADGTNIAAVGPNGEIPLSAAIVNKVNPQNLIKNASEVSVIDPSGNVKTTAVDTSSALGVGAFILITLLATAVNVVGLIVFLSVGMIFVARVIGLWVAMIVVPLAFFTYMVPSMQGFGMIGWKKWWPETLSLAFLAPIFIFFVYLILKFLDTGLNIINATGQTGTAFVIATIVPFAFIMILLLRAKKIAKDLSGTIGQSITGGVAAAGSLALGGAALGVAALGRGTIGAFMKGASTGDTAAERARTGTSRGRVDLMKGRLANITGVGRAQRAVGARLNANQHDIEHAAHARHDLDTAAGVVAHGKKWSELNGDQRLQARTNMERVVEMRNMGLGNRTWAQISDGERTLVTAAIAPRLATNTTAGDRTIQDARRKVGLGENLIQSTVGGSFDVRNLSKMIAGEQDKTANKIVTGMTAAVTGGMRSAFKASSINFGTGQKSFFKDLGHTITEALKSTQIKADLSHVGEEKKEDGHGGGGHH